jgi:flagellar biosynthesis protein
MDKSKKNKSGLKKIKHRVDQLETKPLGKSRAIALKYDVDKSKAPKIVATGKGNIAEMILKVAEENKIPFYEDESLTDLLSKLELDDEVPKDLYGLVAEVLAFVYQLDRLAKKRQKVKQRYNRKTKEK